MPIRIVTDGTYDLPQEIIREYGITVVPLFIRARGREYQDGESLTRTEFDERLPFFRPAATTAAPGPDVFRLQYERLASEGATEILSIHIPEKLSGMVNVAGKAAKEAAPVPVTVFDSRRLSRGDGVRGAGPRGGGRAGAGDAGDPRDAGKTDRSDARLRRAGYAQVPAPQRMDEFRHGHPRHPAADQAVSENVRRGTERGAGSHPGSGRQAAYRTAPGIRSFFKGRRPAFGGRRTRAGTARRSPQPPARREDPAGGDQPGDRRAHRTGCDRFHLHLQSANQKGGRVC
jgi:hypothetical protein